MEAKTTTGPDAAAQQAVGITRVDLQQQDLSVPGREMIQNRVELTPQAPAVRHFHYGEEIIYVLEGTMEYTIEGQDPRTVKAGEALTVPAQAVHAVRNVGSGPAAELGTFIVEKGKPLITLAD
jgi:quercetin dioxygenase-like cupin family protein